jgi:hypothetical protein
LEEGSVRACRAPPGQYGDQPILLNRPVCHADGIICQSKPSLWMCGVNRWPRLVDSAPGMIRSTGCAAPGIRPRAVRSLMRESETRESDRKPPVAGDHGESAEAAAVRWKRRRVLVRGGKLLAYTAPLVLLYRPRRAFATPTEYSIGG